MEIDISEGKSEKLTENCLELKEILRVSSEDLSFEQFFQEFMSVNLPVVIKNIKIKTSVSHKWFDENGRFEIGTLSETLQDHKVPVANCSKQYFDSHEKIQMTFCEYSSYWRGKREAGLLYLKDFHFKQEFPHHDFYKVPPYFASDWLNEYLIDTGKDDYRFIYFGPKETWTPFHSDVFGSFSWSANIYGRKHWFILPPGEELKLKDQLGNLPFSINSKVLEESKVKYFELIQESDETLFVPSKWYHQVQNLDDSVSVNHNWFNGCNVNLVLDSLLSHHDDVEREISDCKEMENYNDHCQLMLKSSFGMNLDDFVGILAHIANKRIKSIIDLTKLKMFEDFTIGTNLKIYDLKVVSDVCNRLKHNEIVQRFDELLNVVIDCETRIKDISLLYSLRFTHPQVYRLFDAFIKVAINENLNLT